MVIFSIPKHDIYPIGLNCYVNKVTKINNNNNNNAKLKTASECGVQVGRMDCVPAYGDNGK